MNLRALFSQAPLMEGVYQWQCAQYKPAENVRDEGSRLRLKLRTLHAV